MKRYLFVSMPAATANNETIFLILSLCLPTTIVLQHLISPPKAAKVLFCVCILFRVHRCNGLLLSKKCLLRKRSLRALKTPGKKSLKMKMY